MYIHIADWPQALPAERDLRVPPLRRDAVALRGLSVFSLSLARTCES